MTPLLNYTNVWFTLVSPSSMIKSVHLRFSVVLKKTHCEIFRYSFLVTEHIKLQAAKVITIKYVTSLRQNNKKPNDINLFIFNICKNMGYIN